MANKKLNQTSKAVAFFANHRKNCASTPQVSLALIAATF